MERHVQSLLQGLILVALIWVGSTLIELQKASASTQTSVAEIKEQIKAMDGRFTSYLPRTEADIRNSSLDGKDAEHDRRLNSIDSKIEQIRNR